MATAKSFRLNNGIDMPAPLPEATEPTTVAFVATMGWAPNTDAALWLGRDIWPRVEAEVRGARLLLVGRDPTPAVRALASPTVEVTGTVALRGVGVGVGSGGRGSDG